MDVNGKGADKAKKVCKKFSPKHGHYCHKTCTFLLH